MCVGNWESSVRVVTQLVSECSGVQLLAGSIDYFFCKTSGSAKVPTESSVQWLLGTLLGTKQLECEGDLSIPFSGEVKNAWKYISTIQDVSVAQCLITQRDIYTLCHKF
jgi:hypothetical protein